MTTPEGVAIQTLWLGEYYTPVTQLVIRDVETGEDVVRLDARSDRAMMHTVSVHTGVNDFQDVYLEDYVVTYPAGRPYPFRAGVPYRRAPTGVAMRLRFTAGIGCGDCFRSPARCWRRSEAASRWARAIRAERWLRATTRPTMASRPVGMIAMKSEPMISLPLLVGEGGQCRVCAHTAQEVNSTTTHIYGSCGTDVS